MTASTKQPPKPITLQLKALTPVSVLNGQQIAAFTDYLFIEDDICLLNHKRISDRLRAKDDLDLVEAYTGILNKITDTRFRNIRRNDRNARALTGFLENDLLLDADDYIQHRIPYEGDGEPTIQLKTIVKNHKSPFIPGSTLKGAIKNAMAYHWLAYDQFEGMQVLDRIIGILRGRESVEAKFVRLNRADSQGTAPMKQIDAWLWEDFKRDASKHNWRISVSDCSPCQPDDLFVYETKLYQIKKQQLQIPELREGIAPKSTASFTLTFNTLNERSKWNISKVYKALQTFARDNLNEDQDSLNAAIKDPNEEVAEVLNGFYDEMQEVLKAKDKTLMRLGRGKSYYHNSIGLAIKNKAPELLSTWRKVYRLYRKMPEEVSSKYFPLTRTVDTMDLEPFGWVELTFPKNQIQ